ncbi:MAG: ankyrin repeat domain-containing protein [Pseudomonadota bacterium]
MDVVLSDPLAARAVALIDAGEAAALAVLLADHPALLSETIDVGPEAAEGGYFARPRLLWFVAENPIRTGRLPAAIVEVSTVIVDAARKATVPSLQEDLDTTLGLVASGLVARETGAQAPLIAHLAAEGADPNPAMRPALAHREIAAAEALVTAGARLDLFAAAGLGQSGTLMSLLSGAEEQALQDALSVAAIAGQAECVRLLLAAGADPNRFNAPGLHGHTAPIHQAVYSDALETVQALIEGGADPDLPDRSYGGTALGWAIHNDRPRIAAWLRTRAEYR